MCKYCDGEFVGDKPITPLNEKNYGIEVIVERECLYTYCSCGKHIVTMINYCPMCGEKLGEEADD